MKSIQFTKNHIELTPEDLEDEIDPILKAINDKFEVFTKECIELVQLTESATHAPEFVVLSGRNLLTQSAQLKSSLIAWVNGNEPEWYLEQKAWDQYEEDYQEYTEEYNDVPDDTSNRPPAPPPPPINFSAPVKLKMIETGQKSSMTQEMIDKLEKRQQEESQMQNDLNEKMKALKGTGQVFEKGAFVDELLIVVQSGLKNLKPVSQRVIPPKPIIDNPVLCAFTIVDEIMARRAAVEGDDEDEWSDESWSEHEDD